MFVLEKGKKYPKHTLRLNLRHVRICGANSKYFFTILRDAEIIEIHGKMICAKKNLML